MARSSVRTISVGRSFVRSGAQRSSKCRRRGVFLWTVPSNCRYVRKASRMARPSSSALSVPGQARARASFFSHRVQRRRTLAEPRPSSGRTGAYRPAGSCSSTPAVRAGIPLRRTPPRAPRAAPQAPGAAATPVHRRRFRARATRGRRASPAVHRPAHEANSRAGMSSPNHLCT